MAKDNKNLNKKPKVSPYWIYGIIIAVFLGLQLFGGSAFQSSKIIKTSEFINYLEQGDVEEVVIISNTKTARVYLTDEALKKIFTKTHNQKDLYLLVIFLIIL